MKNVVLLLCGFLACWHISQSDWTALGLIAAIAALFITIITEPTNDGGTDGNHDRNR